MIDRWAMACIAYTPEQEGAKTAREIPIEMI